MKIKKLGHCCLLIEEKGVRILTDPGNYSITQNEIKNIDLILITHEHADHLHIDSLKQVIKNNPKAKIITNKAVGSLLDADKINYEVIEDGKNTKFKEILIEAIEGKHEFIYTGWKDVQNTGFFISNKLFYPGDSFKNPGKKVDILALPVAGPWCKISDAVNYALKVKPRIAFPVHDGALKVMGGNHRVPEKILPENNIEFIILEEGKEREFN
ncbi:MAG: MBL fold metallo-hydrolase [Nanoarchaeota archaeon]